MISGSTLPGGEKRSETLSFLAASNLCGVHYVGNIFLLLQIKLQL